MKLFRIVGFFLVSALAAGCATTQPFKPESPANQADTLISQDLVSVLSQVPTLNAGQVTLRLPQLNQLNDQFGKALVLTLQNVGYALRTTGGDEHSRPVSYTINQTVGSSEGATYTYTVNVGDVSVRRTYKPQPNGRVTPVSDLQVRGALAAQLTIDNDLFQRGSGSQKAAPTPNQQPAPKPLPEFVELPSPQAPITNTQSNSSAIALATTQQPPVVPIQLTQPATIAGEGLQRAPTSPGTPFSSETPTTPAISAPREKQNVRNLGESNFASILNTLGTVKETVLIFDNDSINLGSNNKAEVEQFVKEFDPAIDIFSVIGCSHGPTALSGGQKSLALGRAQRIKEALMFAGVPENSILDEACWAHDQFDKRMPRRGVVLALKRRV